MAMANELPVERFYDELARSWDATRPQYMTRVFERIAAHLDERCASVLDFGCGTGLLCRYLHEKRPGMRVHGVDVSSQMTAKARSNCPECVFHEGDINSVDLPHFDAVVSKDVFNHVPDIETTIGAIDGVLNPGGALVIANRERGGGVRERLQEVLSARVYSVAQERHEFAPTVQEVSAFIESLTGLSETHRARVRVWLETPGEYYILAARKGS